MGHWIGSVPSHGYLIQSSPKELFGPTGMKGGEGVDTDPFIYSIMFSSGSFALNKLVLSTTSFFRVGFKKKKIIEMLGADMRRFVWTALIQHMRTPATDGRQHSDCESVLCPQPPYTQPFDRHNN